MTQSLLTGLGGEGPSLTMTWRGRPVTLRQLKWASVIAELESWLIDKALKAKLKSWRAQVDEGLMTREEAREAADRFTDECVEEGRYSFGSEPMMKILAPVAGGAGASLAGDARTLPAFLKLGSLLTGLDEDSLTELVADDAARDELMAKLGMVIGGGLPPKAEGATPAPPTA